MTMIPKIGIEQFHYELPDEKIAKHPINQRDRSKMLIWNKGEICDDSFMNVATHLPSDSLMVFNNTKVIRARLFFRKPTGALIEVFGLEPVDPSDYALVFQQREECSWKCMVGNQKKWMSGRLSMMVTFEGTEIELISEHVDNQSDRPVIRFRWNNSSFAFSEVLEAAGKIPIPPYLNRESEECDLIDYQTVYSKEKGSVAAPTAGLHFTDEVFRSIRNKGIDTAELTLHVGAGTFQPVKSKTIDGHQMHEEQIIVSRETIEKLLMHEGRVIAVGTTSVRSLESVYWFGNKLLNNPGTDNVRYHVDQWEPYNTINQATPKAALEAVRDFFVKKNSNHIAFSTGIIIVPGYRFRMIEGMLTNFHQPRSTLLLLIAAFIGNDWEKVYQHALRSGYRFLSYGDSNLYIA
jgi:S-adenosylmethionine:tRNA ribosyltransferase-isomerase